MAATLVQDGGPPRPTLRVLIVEDSQIDADLMVRALERHGLTIYAERVETAADMQAALQSGAWNLVLTDHILPQFNSRQALAIVRASGLDLPVIVVSGSLGEEMAVDLIRAGADDYLLKDRLARLGPAVERALLDAEERLAHRQAEQALAESQRALALQNEIARIMLAVPDDGMYAGVLEVMQAATASAYGVFCYLDELGAAVMAAQTHGVWEACEVPGKPIRFPHETWGDSIWARSMLTRTTVVKNAPGAVPIGHVPILNALAVPIISQGEPLGHFLLANKQSDYGSADVTLVERVAEYVAPVLRARLERDRREALRQQAEQALQESQRDLAALIDNSQDSIWSLDNDYRLLVANSVYLQDMRMFFGVELALGDSVLAATAEPWVMAEWRGYYDRALAGESFTVEARHAIADPPRYGEVRLSPIRRPDGSISGAVAQWHDITHRKQAEIALRQSEELYRSLFENMLNGFAYCQMHCDPGKPLDFTYLTVNKAFETLTGLKNAAGKRVSEVIPGIQKSDPEVLERYRRVAMTGQPEQFETLIEALQMWFSVSAYSPKRGYFVAVFDVITERKRAEEALRESQAQLQRLLDGAPDPIFVQAAERFAYLNQAACALFGAFDPSELLGQPIIERFHPSGRVLVAQRVHQTNVERSDLPRIEETILRLDGSLVEVETSVVPMRYDGRDGALVFMRDVTERKRAEHALAASETRYRRLFEAAQDGILILDADTGQVLDANPFICRLLGYARPELEGKALWQIGILKDIAASREAFLALQNAGYIRYEDLPLEAADGRRIEVEFVSNVYPIDGSRVIQCNIRDITARKRAEAALRESRQMLRTVLDTIPVRVFWKDRQSRYLGANRAFAQDHGLDNASLLLGKTDADLGLAAAADLYRTQDGQVLDSGVPIVDLEEQRELPSHGRIWLRGSKVPLRDDAGVTIGVLGAYQDVTERKLAEQALRESEEQYHQLFEMESDAIVLVENATGRILAANSAATALYGFSHEELQAMRNSELSAEPEETQRVTQGEPVISDRLVTIPLRHHRKRDGTVFPVEITGRFFEWRGHSVHIAAIRDITERLRAEQALRASEEQYHRLAENIQDYIMRYDRQFRHVYANTAAIAVTGRTHDEYIGKTYREMGFPEHLCAQWERAIQRVFDTGQPQREVFEWASAGGTVVLDWRVAPEFAPDGHVETVLALARDITALRHGEEALRQREHLLDRIFDILPVGLWLADKQGTLVRSNAAGRAIWGAEPLVSTDRYGVFKGRRLPSGQEIAADDWALARTIREGAVVLDEMIEIDAFDGQKRVILNSTAPVLDDAGQVEAAIVVNQEITGLVRAEDALRQSEERFRTVADWTYDWEIWSLPGRKTIYVSPSAERISGYTPAEFLADTQLLSRIIHPQDRTIFEAHHAESRELNPAVHTLDFRIVTRAGQVRWINHVCRPVYGANGEYLGRRASHRDITEQRRAQEERERLMSAIEQAGEAVIITDPLGMIQYVNPAFERITGYARAEALGRNPSILQSGEHDDAFYTQLWDTINSGRTWQGRFINRRKDGALYTEEATISPVRDGAGAISNYVAVKRDISASLAMEREQERLQAQLLQAQKMESIGRLAGGVAHDFNNMLSVILGNAELAIADVDPSAQLHHDLQEILTAAQRSADLTRQLLAFARRQTVSPKVLDLNDTVTGMLKMLGRLIGEDVSLVWRPGHDLWRVRIDPTQVDQMLANLCANARDAIGGVGSVAIETANFVMDDDYCAAHMGFRPGEYVQLTVTDDGSGMDSETLSHLFEPFYTTKAVGKGTGLGLATIYGIIKQNDGFVNVYSELSHGTTFKLYIPRYVAADERAASEELVTRPRGGNETILIVEDERSVLNLGRIILTRLGYTVLAAGSPREGLAQAQEHDGQIQLLITDVVMPEMNGRELAERLTTLRPGIKCLYMSGYTANVIAHRGVLDEGVLFLQKPYTTRDLAAKVREALDG